MQWHSFQLDNVSKRNEAVRNLSEHLGTWRSCSITVATWGQEYIRFAFVPQTRADCLKLLPEALALALERGGSHMKGSIEDRDGKDKGPWRITV
jgi:hypothetical protein